MNRIVKNSLIFCSVLFALTIPVSGVMAMMGGGHHGGGSGGFMSGSGGGANYDDHMEGSYYLTDILGQDGSVIDRVIVDKNTGQVRSIR